jgi:hypothetical protein
VSGGRWRKRFPQVRARNRRATELSYRHPWRYAAVYATASSVAPAVGAVVTDSLHVAFPVAIWVTSFLVYGMMTRRRAGQPHLEPLSTPPTDLTLRGDGGPVMGEDGRRWRTGSA